MYAIIVYDVAQGRVNKVCGFLRQHLNWVQNSVFEGEITESGLQRIKNRLADIIELNEDSVLVYTLSNCKWLVREVIGIEKQEIRNVL